MGFDEAIEYYYNKMVIDGKSSKKKRTLKGAGRKPRFNPELGETTTFSCRVPKLKKKN